MTDVGLQHLREMNSIRRLQICECRFTDSAMKYSREMPALRMLNMQCITGFSDTALKSLAHLENLSIAGASTEGSGMSHLKPLTRLHKFSLRSAKNDQVSDNALTELPAYPKLETLEFSWSAVSDRVVAEIPELPCLRPLDLSYTEVTYVAGAHLAQKCLVLEYVNWGGTRTTDQAIQHLLTLPMFERVRLNVTKVPENGVKELLAAKSQVWVTAKSDDLS